MLIQGERRLSSRNLRAIRKPTINIPWVSAAHSALCCNLPGSHRIDVPAGSTQQTTRRPHPTQSALVRPSNNNSRPPPLFLSNEQVLTNVCINSSEKPVENFHKISREVLENSLAWSEEPAPLKLDLSKQAESTSLFQVDTHEKHKHTPYVYSPCPPSLPHTDPLHASHMCKHPSVNFPRPLSLL